MNLTRCAWLVPIVSSLLLAGCQIRDGSTVQSDELAAENQRLQNQVQTLDDRTRQLQASLDSARDELAKAKGDSSSLGSQLKSILSGPDIAGTTPTENGGLALNEDFAFAKGSAELNPDGKASIGQIAKRLNEGEYAKTAVVIEGHTDDTPVARASTKEKYVDNWGLSAARAASVIRALVAAGVEPTRLHGAFRGEYAPRYKEGDKARNRRVEISVRMDTGASEP